MPPIETLLRALGVSIPLGIILALGVVWFRRRWAHRMGEGRASLWEWVRRGIYLLGILLFTALAAYCWVTLGQPVFAGVYGFVALLNAVCLRRSYRREKYDANGVPIALQRKPRRVMPTVG